MSQNPQDNDNNERDYLAIPDLTVLWKEMYFQTEAALADAMRQFTYTNGFSQYIDNLLQQHLALEKIKNQSIDAYMENTAIPSKKDVARLAELLIAVEEKIDNIEFGSFLHIQSMAANLAKLVEGHEHLKKDITTYQESLKKVEKKLDNLNKEFTKLKLSS